MLLDMYSESENSTNSVSDPRQSILEIWHRVPVLVRATALGFIVNVIGVYSWVLVLIFVPSPWQIVAMGVILCIYWKVFSGSWWSKSSKKARVKTFSMIGMSIEVQKLSLLAAVFFVIVSQSSLIVTFRLVAFPTELFTIYDLEGIPLWLAWMFVIMAALVAGICEETGFRGYMQGPLEECYGPVVSISFVSIIFLLSHLHQVWAASALLHLFMLSTLLGVLAYSAGSIVPSIIAHVCMDIFAFSYWWSDLLGKFEMHPISVTGIDFHFIFWFMILVISSGLFLWTSKKVMLTRLQERSNMPNNKQQEHHCEKISENWIII